MVVTINADTNNNAAAATNAFTIKTGDVVVASYIASYDFTNGVPFTLTASGTINQTYVTQRSTNLTDWVNIATNTADANGAFDVSDSFSDLDGNAPSPLFYRLQSQLP